MKRETFFLVDKIIIFEQHAKAKSQNLSFSVFTKEEMLITGSKRNCFLFTFFNHFTLSSFDQHILSWLAFLYFNSLESNQFLKNVNFLGSILLFHNYIVK